MSGDGRTDIESRPVSPAPMLRLLLLALFLVPALAAAQPARYVATNATVYTVDADQPTRQQACHVRTDQGDAVRALVFRGILLPEFADLWTAEALERRVAGELEQRLTATEYLFDLPALVRRRGVHPDRRRRA